MRLLCFSDIHGCVDAVRELIAATRARQVSYDAVILAGDITNLVVTKNMEEAQRHSDEIMSLLCDEYSHVYFVPGNRDKLGRGKKARTVGFKCGTLLGPGEVYPLPDGIRITSSPELADHDTILVQHSNIVYAGRFDRTAMISKDALLHITGHTHTGVWTRNYLNTGFLYRDDSNGAEPMMGGYFDVDIQGRKAAVQFHALGPVKWAPLKSAGFDGDVYAPHGRAFPVKLALA
ncbi:MAG TPA: metallophosphoesterase [Methanocella sp.]